MYRGRIYSLIFISAVLMGSALFVGRVFVYDTNIAHPGLTKLAAGLYNSQTNGAKLSDQEIKWLMAGAIEEDTPLRWMNHFYDPVYDRGLKGSYDSAKEWAVDVSKQITYSKGNQTWQAAIYQFQKGNKKQAFVALGHILHLLEDMTVPAHTRDDAHPEGDPYEVWVKTNFKAMPAAPIYFSKLDKYFDYLANYSNNNFYSEDTIENKKYNVLKREKVEKHLSSVGKYFNYFFVKDLFNNEYPIFLIKTAEIDWKAYISPADFKIQQLDTTVNDPLILSSHYSLLAPKAIGAGAGVIKLFFEETQKQQAYQPPAWQITPLGIFQEGSAEAADNLYTLSQNLSQQGQNLWSAAKKLIWNFSDKETQWNFITELLAANAAVASELKNLEQTAQIFTAKVPAQIIFETSQAVANLDSRFRGNDSVAAVSAVSEPQLPKPTAPPASSSAPLESFNKFPASDFNSGFLFQPTAPLPPPSPLLKPAPSPAPVTSGGGVSWSSNAPTPPSSTTSALTQEDSSASPQNDNSGQVEPPEPEPLPLPDTTPPEAPVILEPLASPAFTTSATADLSGSISLDTFKLTINGQEIVVASVFWQTIVNLVEGENIFDFVAADIAGNQSAVATVKIIRDTLAPAVTLQAARVNVNALQTSWQAVDAGIGVDFYNVEYQENDLGAAASSIWTAWQTNTTSTQAELTVSFGKQYSFRARAADKLSNVSEWIESSVQEIDWPKVVINEIAWAGTKAAANDEWLELYNASDYDFDLSNWILADGNDINFVFPTSTFFASRSFFLMERTADTTVSDIAMDLKYAGSLNDKGETLQLKNAAGRVIDEVGASNGWFAGKADSDKQTMERLNSLVSGNLASNWQATPLLPRNGYDAKGNAINGTPKRFNSPLIYLDGVMKQNRTLSAIYNPYFLGNFTVASGTTLTIPAGVVIKAGSPAGGGGNLAVYGALITQGTAEAPVVFTSYRDSSFVGNTNTWSASQTPAGSDWNRLYFYSGSRADLQNTKILYGNYRLKQTDPNGALVAEGAEIIAASVMVSQARVGEAAVNLTNSSSAFSNCAITQNTFGVLTQGGAISFEGCVFESNGIQAVKAENSTVILKNNIFKNNGWDNAKAEWWKQSPFGPVAVRNAVPVTEGNQFENNALNGVDWGGAIMASSTLVLDNSKDWPWISGGFTVAVSSTLQIKSNSRIKMKNIANVIINGALQADGADGAPIIFTSWRDDSDGFDNNGDGSATAPNATGLEWAQMKFESSATSTLNYLTVRYANQPTTGQVEGSMHVKQTPLIADHLTIEYSRHPGTALHLQNTSQVEIKNGLMKNYAKPTSPSWETVGILIDGGAPAIQAIIDTFTRGIKTKNSPDLSKVEALFVNVNMP